MMGWRSRFSEGCDTIERIFNAEYGKTKSNSIGCGRYRKPGFDLKKAYRDNYQISSFESLCAVIDKVLLTRYVVRIRYRIFCLGDPPRQTKEGGNLRAWISRLRFGEQKKKLLPPVQILYFIRI